MGAGAFVDHLCFQPSSDFGKTLSDGIMDQRPRTPHRPLLCLCNPVILTQHEQDYQFSKTRHRPWADDGANHAMYWPSSGGAVKLLTPHPPTDPPSPTIPPPPPPLHQLGSWERVGIEQGGLRAASIESSSSLSLGGTSIAAREFGSRSKKLRTAQTDRKMYI